MASLTFASGCPALSSLNTRANVVEKESWEDGHNKKNVAAAAAAAAPCWAVDSSTSRGDSRTLSSDWFIPRRRQKTLATRLWIRAEAGTTKVGRFRTNRQWRQRETVFSHVAVNSSLPHLRCEATSEDYSGGLGQTVTSADTWQADGRVDEQREGEEEEEAMRVPQDSTLGRQVESTASMEEERRGSLTSGRTEEEEEKKKKKISTRLLQFKDINDPYGAMSSPLYQTATFELPDAITGGAYDYTRSGNPTRTQLENMIASLEGADRGLAFSTGMAALSAVTRLAEAGQEIVAGDDIYGGTDRLLTRVVPRSGVRVKRVDTSQLDAVRAAMTSSTKMVIIESPTNPRLLVSDVRAIADIAHEYGAILVVDNSIMSPVLSRPLELGADVVVHSATKFISGHSDVMAGLIAVRGEELAKEVYFLQNAEGTGLSPFDCWLCLRGAKTMSLRVEKQQENAQRVAEYLASNPLVKRVNYVGLKTHAGHDLHYSQCAGAGSVLSFQTGSLDVSKHVVDNVQLFAITVSFGSVRSLISLPCFMSHASIPLAVREERGLTDDLVRLSIGIEDADDLIADLHQAFQGALSLHS